MATSSFNSKTTGATGFTEDYPTGYKFNLPPHNWSLATPTSKIDELPGKTRKSFNNKASLDSFERRGRIWRWGNAVNLVGDTSQIQVNPSTNKSSLKGPITNSPLKGPIELNQPAGNTTSVYSSYQAFQAEKEKNKYGFQFLWNPESYSANTGLSFNITPAATDSYSAGNIFQGTADITFDIELNRINDFACFKSVPSDKLSRYYGKASSAFTEADINNEIAKLKTRGTLSDLEYLYKAVNGGAIKNLANKDTSDIGILVPQQLRVDIGPYSQICYIAGLNVSHLMFTQDMIPIRTRVVISLRVLSSFGYQSNPTILSSSNPQDNPNPSTRPKVSVEKQRTLNKLKGIK